MSRMTGGWRVAFRNLRRNKRRNVATALAIAIGFAALLVIGGYVHRVENYLRVYSVYASRSGHLAIYQKGGLENHSVKPRLYSLDAREQKIIREALGASLNVEFFGAQLFGTGLIGNGCKTLPFIGTGIEPAVEARAREHPEMRRWAPDLRGYRKGDPLAAYPDDFGAVILSDGLARLLGKPKVVDDLKDAPPPLLIAECQGTEAAAQIAADANVQLVAGSWSGMMSALDGEVVAHYSTGITETNNSALLTSLAHLQKLYDTDHVTLIAIWLKDPKQLEKLRADLQGRLAAAGLAVEIYPWDDERISPFYTGTMDFLATLVGFVSVILVSIVIFSIFNAATMTIIERAQEIGMMRSLGYTRRQVRLLFIREGTILAGMAIAMGGLAAFVGLSLVNNANIRFHPPGIAGGMQLLLIPSIRTVMVAATAILALAIVTTFLAVRSVTKSNIAALLQGSSR